MSKLSYIAAAQAIAQVSTVTVSGTWAAGETITLFVGPKKVTYTATGTPTTSTVAAGLQALAAASTDPEFTEITFTVSTNVVTCTAKNAGVPFTVTVSETAATGSAAASDVTNATGPNHWDNVANWSTGAVPTTGDEVSFENKEAVALYGLPTSLTISKLTIKLGQLGLPDKNAAGYNEYRTTKAVITCTNIVIGISDGNGPDLVRLSTASAAAVVLVRGSKKRSDIPAVYLLLNNSGASVNIVSGQVGIAYSETETTTVGTVRNSNQGEVYIGPGTTITTASNSGSMTIRASVTTLTNESGTTIVDGDNTITTCNVKGGNVSHRSTGTITALVVGPGIADFGQDNRPRTVTDCTINKSGTFRDPQRVVTVTNGIILGSDADSLTAA